ncbi:hypothetical protein AKFMO35_09620 [Apilactobacillus kunkeei]
MTHVHTAANATHVHVTHIVAHVTVIHMVHIVVHVTHIMIHMVHIAMLFSMRMVMFPTMAATTNVFVVRMGMTLHFHVIMMHIAFMILVAVIMVLAASHFSVVFFFIIHIMLFSAHLSHLQIDYSSKHLQ